MRHLKIDLSELELAFESGSEMVSYYLDVETGEIHSSGYEERRLLERIYENYYDEEAQTVDWETAFEGEGVPGRQRELLLDADRVEAGFGERFIAIPAQDSREGYRDMEAFIATLSDPRLQERLDGAIRGRGAFYRFKDVLLDFPAERERWFEFKQERVRQRVVDWLQEEGIVPSDED